MSKKVTLDILKRIIIANSDGEVLINVEGKDVPLAELPDDKFENLELQEDLEIDSIELVVFLMEIEKECNIGMIDIPDQKFRQVKTVKDFINLCNQAL